MAERYPPADPSPGGSALDASGARGTDAGGATSSAVGSRSVERAPGLRVRPALRSDVAAIKALEQASFSDPWSASSFRSSLDRPEVHMTVAESTSEGGESAVVGYLVAWFIGREGEIANIAVAASWQRRGVGAALLDEVLAAGRAVEVDSIYLEVRDSNAAARALYTGRGFRAVGRRRQYYLDPPEDALVLKWEAEPSSADAGV